jgi:hypothetical protein
LLIFLIGATLGPAEGVVVALIANLETNLGNSAMKLMHLAVGAAMLAGTTAATAQDAPRSWTPGPV